MNATATNRTPATQWLSVMLVSVAMVIGLAAAGLAWYRVAHALTTARPVKVPTIRPVSGIVWGGRVFETRAALAAWLHSRGATYATWAERHPALARVLETRR